MRIYPTIFKLVFEKMDPEKAHHIGFWGVQTLKSLGISRALRSYLQPDASLRTRVMGIDFPSPFGLAAGFDKGGKGIAALAALGFGHVEIGTITGQAQPGNPQPRLFRLVEDRAVINRMGFNNDGAAAAGPRVAAARADLEAEYPASSRPVIGVNIGKTKVVELENAIDDYLISTRTLAPQADYLTVNVSSPNTPGLRSLQSIEALRPLLAAVRAEADKVVPNRHVPLTVKIAPDLADEDVIEVARLAKELKLDGVIATNTTIAREGLGLRSDMSKVKNIGAGGLSGAPLKPRSLEVLSLLKKEIGDELAIISVGGVTDARDVQERLDAGADLVQGYTAFLYEGPFWVARINRGLAKLRR
ncbi:MAG: quinone-dependent dihydroorotate dehydrogenase [Rothia sp. (in: high G+C Gram-positive bacteria)]|uniref:quinone-dependent dihydroorotate dehydrogenase n=1 Tax=Rothia sp. (in: high G+C Gram-positive bacteria) TaxID=1885016 RepID=UPI0026DEE922|nr:quinone-dependent dihydroorotate dehydrogenase [Rothia sp. (in: high G+C Gram-positive bacteria)]MDO5750649.1 quinone-dependent dihydroorotate dehydrogenase [Rothia sp. (in: high G+C Gram-positive bacteria)]